MVGGRFTDRYDGYDRYVRYDRSKEGADARQFVATQLTRHETKSARVSPFLGPVVPVVPVVPVFYGSSLT